LDDNDVFAFLTSAGDCWIKDGNLTADVSADGVHLTGESYPLWAEAIRPVVRARAE